MANSCSSSRFLGLLIVLVIAPFQPAGAKPLDLTLYPLRVHIFESDWKNGAGSGRADLTDGKDVHGIDFSYACPNNYMRSIGNEAYAAKWKKPEKTIEIVGNKVGEQKNETCEFKITLHDYVYYVENGTLVNITQEQYKVRVGAALARSAPVDADPSHYPIGLSVLEVNWTPLQNGTRTATGRGNLRLPTGLSSVDFTSDCNLAFPVTGENRYYSGRWTQEGSALALLLLVASGDPHSCTLKTSVHSDVYIRDASGTLKAVSAEEYRNTILKRTAPAATQPASPDTSVSSTTPKSASAVTPATPVAQTSQSAKEPIDDSPLPRNQGKPVVVVEPGKSSASGPASAQAAVLYRKACDAGTAVSCRNLAIQYANGTGVTQDYAQAAVFYHKACNGGDAGGCANLGLLYERGNGVAKDVTQAATLYRKACDVGNKIGCGNLGLMYATGTGVPQDYAQAVALDRKACDQGVAISCSNLGLLQPRPHVRKRNRRTSGLRPGRVAVPQGMRRRSHTQLRQPCHHVRPWNRSNTGLCPGCSSLSQGLRCGHHGYMRQPRSPVRNRKWRIQGLQPGRGALSQGLRGRLRHRMQQPRSSLREAARHCAPATHVDSPKIHRTLPPTGAIL
jgi:hypothetical protein